MDARNLVARASSAIGLSRGDVMRIVKTAPHRYKTYTIPKRSGGVRTIAQPARELKDVQYFLIRELLQKLPVHEAATAYRKNVGILKNAEPHVASEILLKMDFKDFFGSIVASDFIQHCEAHEVVLDPEDAFFCQQVLFWQEKRRGPLKLSIGAPSSPMLSNSIVYGFDRIVQKLCKDIGVIYSRYADDLAFSSNEVAALIRIRAEVPKILASLNYPVLYINHEKTALITKKHRRTLTGLVLANDGFVSLGREKKRILRAAVHAYLNRTLSGDEILALRGQLAFCKSVEPAFIARLAQKYGKLEIATLMKRPPE
jgi:RNA-directed DNA polymerase